MPPLVITVPGEIKPKGRPRFGRTRDGRPITFTDPQTASAENLIKVCAAQACLGQRLLEGAIAVTMAVTVKIPPSWSKRKQAQAHAGSLLPTGRPDLDNIAKSLDALNNVVWRDDAQIVELRVSKRYGDAPGAVITVQPA